MRTGILDWTVMSRSLLFALAGILLFVFWAVARPSSEMTASDMTSPVRFETMAMRGAA